VVDVSQKEILMRKATRVVVLAGFAVLIAIQFVRPARTNPATDPSRTLGAHVAMTPEAAAVLDKACRDCHSNDTRWPWYSNLAPVSWFVIDHVNHGRSHFNYSDWAQYKPEEAERLLQNACAMARKETMPLPSYLRVHQNARLTDRDIGALCDWTDAVRRASRPPLNAAADERGVTRIIRGLDNDTTTGVAGHLKPARGSDPRSRATTPGGALIINHIYA
jgi:hypothetical protein